jgi:hypothetical protein
MVGLLLLCSRPWDELEAFVKTVFSGNHKAALDLMRAVVDAAMSDAADTGKDPDTDPVLDAKNVAVLGAAVRAYPEATVCLNPFRFVWNLGVETDETDETDPWQIASIFRSVELGTLLLAYLHTQIWSTWIRDDAVTMCASVVLTLESEDATDSKVPAVRYKPVPQDTTRVWVYKCALSAHNASSIMEAIRYFQSRARSNDVVLDPLQLRLVCVGGAGSENLLFESGPCHVGWDIVMGHARTVVKEKHGDAAWLVLVSRHDWACQMATQIVHDSLCAFSAAAPQIIASFEFGSPTIPVLDEEVDDHASDDELDDDFDSQTPLGRVSPQQVQVS